MNLSRLPGVESCEVSYEAGLAKIYLSPGVEPDLETIYTTIRESGFTPTGASVVSSMD